MHPLSTHDDHLPPTTKASQCGATRSTGLSLIAIQSIPSGYDPVNWAPASGGFDRFRTGNCAGNSQRHHKPASRTAAFAARLDTASLAPHEIPDDEQTQSQARRRALDVSSDAVETLEDLSQFTGRDPDAAVGDIDENAAISGTRNRDSHLYGLVGILDGVFQQIAKDDGEFSAVAANDRIARLFQPDRVPR
jgi:hypothetical protein